MTQAFFSVIVSALSKPERGETERNCLTTKFHGNNLGEKHCCVFRGRLLKATLSDRLSSQRANIWFRDAMERHTVNTVHSMPRHRSISHCGILLDHLTHLPSSSIREGTITRIQMSHTRYGTSCTTAVVRRHAPAVHSGLSTPCSQWSLRIVHLASSQLFSLRQFRGDKNPHLQELILLPDVSRREIL